MLLERRQLGDGRVRIGRLVAAVAIVAALDVFRAQIRIAVRSLAAIAAIAPIAPRRPARAIGAVGAIRAIRARATLAPCRPIASIEPLRGLARRRPRALG